MRQLGKLMAAIATYLATFFILATFKGSLVARYMGNMYNSSKNWCMIMHGLRISSGCNREDDGLIGIIMCGIILLLGILKSGGWSIHQFEVSFNCGVTASTLQIIPPPPSFFLHMSQYLLPWRHQARWKPT